MVNAPMNIHCTLTCVWFVACSTEHVPSTACMLGGLQHGLENILDWS